MIVLSPDKFVVILSQVIYDKLHKADAIVTTIFFYVFMIVFSFVLVNVATSIIIKAYSDEMDHLDKLSDEQDPLMRLWNALKESPSRPAARCSTSRSPSTSSPPVRPGR